MLFSIHLLNWLISTILGKLCFSPEESCMWQGTNDRSVWQAFPTKWLLNTFPLIHIPCMAFLTKWLLNTFPLIHIPCMAFLTKWLLNTFPLIPVWVITQLSAAKGHSSECRSKKFQIWYMLRDTPSDTQLMKAEIAAYISRMVCHLYKYFPWLPFYSLG